MTIRSSRILRGELLLASAALACVSVAACGTSAGSQPPPGLKFVSQKGYSQTIQGSNWPARSRVMVSLGQLSKVLGLELQTTSNGSFRVGVSNLDLCGGELYRIRDLRGDRVTMRGPALECPVPLNPPTPTLSVLRGTLLAITVTHVDKVTSEGVSIRRADAVYLWEGGTQAPFFVPGVPSHYLDLIGMGKTPPRACPQTECAAGFFWEWVGMNIGKTAISMNPACRPRCEVASYAIPLIITARKPA